MARTPGSKNRRVGLRTAETRAMRQRYANPLCAGCGAGIGPNWGQPPETSLCPDCEDRVGQGQMAWPGEPRSKR